MKIRQSGYVVGVILALFVGPVAAQTSVNTTASVQIEQPAGIIGSQSLVFAVTGTALSGSLAVRGSAVRSTPNVSSAMQVTPSLSSVVPAPARASFVVAGTSGQSISVVVPETVALVRDGGAETALLTTQTNVNEGPQFLAGRFDNQGTLSFDVGGQVVLASNEAVSGTYNGVLAVVAQYN